MTTSSNLFAECQRALCADLGFHASDGRAFAHGWHPFPAKFPPQLPRHFIAALSAPGDVVLDPMFGSGTTVLEAARSGRRAIGCDIDPLARLIAKAKLAPAPPVSTLRAGLAIVDAARRDLHERRPRLERDLDERFDRETREFVDYWFPKTRQLELTALLRAIDALAPAEARPFFEMAFSSTIIAKSGGASLARDLAHTRPHRVADKRTKPAIEAFEKRLRLALRAERDDLLDVPPAQLRDRSAAATGLAPGSVDLIVTSPPYANNAIDYMRAHKFSLAWLGWPLRELRAIRSRCLGHDGLSASERAALPAQCEHTLARLANADRRKAAVLRRYFGEMREVIAEMRRVLKAGKAAIIVVGSSVLRGVDVETHRALAALGEDAGFRLAGIGARRLDRDRRMMPARWAGRGPGSDCNGAAASHIERRMHEEHVIGLIAA